MRLRITFAALLAVIIVPSLWGSSEPSDSVEISLPGKGWSVVADLKGFTIDINGVQPDGHYYLMAHEDDPAFAFSISLTRVSGRADVADCRDTLAQRANNMKSIIQDTHLSESGPQPRLDFIIPELKGFKIHQKNVFACMAREDVYVDVHISKTLYIPQDEPRLESLLQSVRFNDPSRLQTRDSDFVDGTKYYMQHDFPKAIEYYEKVLQREKSTPKLNQTTFRVLVDNLGMAYGISGDFKRAKETFDYGVSKDPTYPLFHYNLACTFGEMGDLKMTRDSLTRAFQFRENVIVGEKMPDPRQDSSFQRFMNDEDFRKFLDSLMASAN
jgi:tetratricopeptide (TPR) repeat protein